MLRPQGCPSTSALEALFGRAALLVALGLALAASSAEARVILVGVDGGSWNVIDPMIAAGELPNFAALERSGGSAELATVEPVTSPVVWTSIATGRTPESHGITDFFDTRLAIRVPTVFERLAARGARVGLYDYLLTWPPVPFPAGFSIPGWLRRDATTAPPDVWERAGVAPFTMSYDRAHSSDAYFQRARAEIAHKARAWNALSRAFPVDVGAVTFYAVDAMSHRFWHGSFPEQFEGTLPPLRPEHRNAVQGAVRGVDRALGEIRGALAPEDTLIVVSDHGFQAGDVDDTVWVSHFEEQLAEAGLDPDRDGFSLISTFGRVVLRVHRGPEEEFEKRERLSEKLAGILRSSETRDGRSLYWSVEVLDGAARPPGRERPWTNRLRQRLVRLLLRLVGVTSSPPVHTSVFAIPRGGVLAELWPGEQVRILDRERPVAEVFTPQVFSGTHLETAIFLAAGGPIVKQAGRGRLSVLDVAPLLLYLAGAPIPDDLEGSLPEQWIDPAHLSRHPPVRVGTNELPGLPAAADDRGAGDDTDLREKLRALGYVE